MKRLTLIASALSMFMAASVSDGVVNDRFHRGPYWHHWR
jgi:hypothetical protein